VEKAAKKTFVLKMLAFNVDEIDGRRSVAAFPGSIRS